jgi:4'-phosphopantetheinyl transferase
MSTQPALRERRAVTVQPVWSPGPRRPILAGTEVQLWRVDLERIPRRAAEMLTVAEHERAERILSPLRRRRWIAARAVLRELLGRYARAEPGALELAEDRLGGPSLEDARGLRFNLSHSGESALYGFSRAGAIGVDIETRAASPLLGRPALLRRLLGAERARELSKLSEAERAGAFLRAWVAHEARLKMGAPNAWSTEIELGSGGLAALACEVRPVVLLHWELEAVSGIARS